MLKQGVGTPYVAIFDSTEKPIMDTTLDLPLGMFVTSFNYEYVEDGCDTADINIHTSNVNIADHPNLQYLMPIKLQWGWILPDGKTKSSPVRSLVVKDYKLTFTNDGVKMDLELSDSSFLLKKEPPSHTQEDGQKPLTKEDGIYDYINNVFKGTTHHIQIKTSTKNSKLQTNEPRR